MTDKTLELAKQAGFEIHPKYNNIIAPSGNELRDGYFGIDKELEAFANLIRADESNWISVDDRLPEQNTDCIVWMPERHSVICCKYFNTWSITTMPDYKLPLITHWMPLPNPPQAMEGE